MSKHDLNLAEYHVIVIDIITIGIGASNKVNIEEITLSLLLTFINREIGVSIKVNKEEFSYGENAITKTLTKNEVNNCYEHDFKYL